MMKRRVCIQWNILISTFTLYLCCRIVQCTRIVTSEQWHVSNLTFAWYVLTTRTLLSIQGEWWPWENHWSMTAMSVRVYRLHSTYETFALRKWKWTNQMEVLAVCIWCPYITYSFHQEGLIVCITSTTPRRQIIYMEPVEELC